MLPPETTSFYGSDSRFIIRTSTISNRCGYKWLTQIREKCIVLQENEYYIDRDPDVFSCILDYCRTGSLHVPHHFCGTVILDELMYWNISPSLIAPCCWGPFTTQEQKRHAGLNKTTSKVR